MHTRYMDDEQKDLFDKYLDPVGVAVREEERKKAEYRAKKKELADQFLPGLKTSDGG